MKYKLLGKSGLRVSELCLGTMTFGEDWGYGANREESEKMFRAYIEAGGNFIDTANRYTEGTSEQYLGEIIKNAVVRDKLVLATKYSLYSKAENGLNESGNHKKNMIQTLNASLKRLQTDYVDIFYLHAWDFTTHVDEVMRAMDDLVRQGKVLYIAISDTPAWIVSRANTMAELRGWSSFIALQVEYSLIQRTVERDLIPMAQAMDIAIIGWAPIAGGALTGKYLSDDKDAKRLKESSTRLNERNKLIAHEVVKVAGELHCSPAQVAIKWVMQQGNQIIPIVGARNSSQLTDNLKVTDINLNEEHLNRLNEMSKIEAGFPHDFLNQDYVKAMLLGNNQGELNIHRKCN